jgi:glycosyltransferase involved in cell wall biosynthesis
MEPHLRSAPLNRAHRLLFVVNNPAFFLSHRLPLALAAKRAGYEVHVATMAGAGVVEIESHGLTQHVIPMTRSGKNPFKEVHSVWALWRLFCRVQPDLVHLVTIKPVMYGGIAARLARVPGMVAAISGLGFVFVSASRKVRLLRVIVVRLYRLALNHPNSRVILQNSSDREVLNALGAIKESQVIMIRGSGVDLGAYAGKQEPPAPIIAIMVARLLRDKGVQEFIEAARLLKQSKVPVTMRLVGSIDPGHPASMAQAEIDQAHRDSLIEALGERQDIAALYASVHIAVLPSYREGLPKSLIEAAACARAVVTTNVPGCRDAIVPDMTGILVPPRDAAALAEGIERLVLDPALRQRMGQEGRRWAEREFNVQEVCSRHLAIYADLLGLTRS